MEVETQSLRSEVESSDVAGSPRARLEDCEFVSDLLDQTLFVHPESKMLICCHVDDLLIIGDPQDAVPMLKRIGTKLQVKYAEVTETPTVYLGRELQGVPGGYRFGIGKGYVRSMLSEFGWSECKRHPLHRVCSPMVRVSC